MPRLSVPKTLFGRRLREARLRAAIPQDKLGVLIGIDEGSSSARISRYETGTHEPPFAIAEKIAQILGVPAAYFYCTDDDLAAIIERYAMLSDEEKKVLMESYPVHR
jgi:transcriptional regulator with XRE-family HTH domain